MFALDNFSNLVESLMRVYNDDTFLVVEQRLYYINDIFTEQDAIAALNNILNGNGTQSIKIYKTPQDQYTIFWDAVNDVDNYIHVGSIIKSTHNSQIFHILCDKDARTPILHLFRYKIDSPTCQLLSDFTANAVAERVEKIYNAARQDGLTPIIFHPHSTEDFNDNVAHILDESNIACNVLTKIRTVDVDPDTIFSSIGGKSLYLNILFRIYLYCYGNKRLPGVRTPLTNSKGEELFWPELFSKDKVTRDLVAINRACLNNNLITQDGDQVTFNIDIQDIRGKTISLSETDFTDVTSQIRFRAGDLIKDGNSFSLFLDPEVNLTRQNYTIVYDDNISTGFTVKQLLKAVNASYGSTAIFGIGVQTVDNLDVLANLDIKHINTGKDNTVNTIQDRIQNPVYLSLSDYNRTLNFIRDKYFNKNQKVIEQITTMLYRMGIRSIADVDRDVDDEQYQQAIEILKDAFDFGFPLSTGSFNIKSEAARYFTVKDVRSFDDYLERLLRPEKFIVKPVKLDPTTITLQDKNNTTIRQLTEAINKAQPNGDLKAFKMVKILMGVVGALASLDDVIDAKYIPQICALYGIKYIQDVATRLRYNVQDEINKLKPYQRANFVKP